MQALYRSSDGIVWQGRRGVREEAGVRNKNWEALLFVWPLASYFVRGTSDGSFKNEVTISVTTANRHSGTHLPISLHVSHGAQT